MIEHPDGKPSDDAFGPHIDLVVRYFPKVQQVELKFDSQELRRWEFICAVLGMGQEMAANNLKLWRMQQIQQQQQEMLQQAMVEQQLRQASHKGKLIQA